MTRYVMLLLLSEVSLAAAAPVAPSSDADSDVSGFIAQPSPAAKPAPAKTAAAATPTPEDEDVAAAPARPAPPPPAASVAPATASTPVQTAPVAPPTTAQMLIPRFVRHYAFKGDTIDSVVSTLIHDYNRPIVLEADPTTKVTGNYSATSLDSILQLISADANLRYERRDGTIYLRGPQAKTGLAHVSIEDLKRLSLNAGDDAQTKSPPPSISIADDKTTPTQPRVAVQTALAQKPVTGAKDQFADLARKRAKLLEERTTLLANGP